MQRMVRYRATSCIHVDGKIKPSKEMDCPLPVNLNSLDLKQLHFRVIPYCWIDISVIFIHFVRISFYRKKQKYDIT